LKINIAIVTSVIASPDTTTTIAIATTHARVKQSLSGPATILAIRFNPMQFNAIQFNATILQQF
jgi:hypothetical protein